MKVTVKKVGDEFVLYVSNDAMGDLPAGQRLYKAYHPQQPFPDVMRSNDASEAMKSAEMLQEYLDKDAQRPNKRKRK